MMEFYEIKYEACWVLTNIAAGTSENTARVVQADMITPLISLLQSDGDQVRVQVMKFIYLYFSL